jgi:uncharacterized protein (TIGR02145 family)
MAPRQKKRFIPLFIAFLALSQGLTDVMAQTDSITDLDGNHYRVVAIGEQWWMAENLKVTKYANGDDIPFVKDAARWAADTAGAYCYYGNRESYSQKYGNLYNWHVAVDERGVCPTGWHVPSDEDWMTMERFLGMPEEEALRMTAWRGTVEGDMLKAEEFGGNNQSGFSALGTGYRDPKGIYKASGTDNDYWTSTPYENKEKNRTEGVLHGFLNTRSDVVRNFHEPAYGFCIRCVKDAGVGTAESERPQDSTFYPNPAGDRLTVEAARGSRLRFLSLTGNTVKDEWMQSERQHLDISDLQQGVYLLSVTGNGTGKCSRLVIL